MGGRSLFLSSGLVKETASNCEVAAEVGRRDNADSEGDPPSLFLQGIPPFLRHLQDFPLHTYTTTTSTHPSSSFHPPPSRLTFQGGKGKGFKEQGWKKGGENLRAYNLAGLGDKGRVGRVRRTQVHQQIEKKPTDIIHTEENIHFSIFLFLGLFGRRKEKALLQKTSEQLMYCYYHVPITISHGWELGEKNEQIRQQTDRATKSPEVKHAKMW